MRTFLLVMAIVFARYLQSESSSMSIPIVLELLRYRTSKFFCPMNDWLPTISNLFPGTYTSVASIGMAVDGFSKPAGVTNTFSLENSN